MGQFVVHKFAGAPRKHYFCNQQRARNFPSPPTRDMTRTGLFVGTFDPFTAGHDSIVRRALPLFDRLVIGVGINERKHCMLSADERTAAIARLYSDEPRIVVRQYGDLTVDLARREEAGFIIKGVRSAKDFEYEREQADINRRLTGVETLLLMAEPGLESVSSSVVRELLHFGKDVSQFLPQAEKKTEEE